MFSSLSESTDRNAMRRLLAALTIFAAIVCSRSGWCPPESGVLSGKLEVNRNPECADEATCKQFCESKGDNCRSIMYDKSSGDWYMTSGRKGDPDCYWETNSEQNYYERGCKG